VIADVDDVEVVEVDVAVIAVAVEAAIVAISSDEIDWDEVGAAVAVGTTLDVKVGAGTETPKPFDMHMVDK
jgi:hypothetical protein